MSSNDDDLAIAELADVIVALQELSAEELMAGGVHVEESWDEVDDPILIGRNGVPVDTWRESDPHDTRTTSAEYDEAKRVLQPHVVELRTMGVQRRAAPAVADVPHRFHVPAPTSWASASTAATTGRPQARSCGHAPGVGTTVIGRSSGSSPRTMICLP